VGETKVKKLPQMALDLVAEGTYEQEIERRDTRKWKRPQEVTESLLYKDIVRIAWPSLIELLLTQLASMVDMMMVGQLGSTALSAVGLTTQPKFLLMTLIMSLNVGATAMVARHKGAGDKDKAFLTLRQALMMNFIIAVLMTVIGIAAAEPLVVFMGAQSDTVKDATIYLQIQMAGFIGIGITSTITSCLRGAGDSRTAMIYNVTANVVNVILNYLLIYGKCGFPRMEVAGASLATIIGQFVAMFMALYAVLKKNDKQYLQLHIKDGFKPDFAALKDIIQIGLPAMLEQLVMRAGMIIFAKTVAGLGTVAYAIHQVCMNILSMSFMLGQAFAVSSTSLVGQSLGKKRSDMAKAYASRVSRIGFVFSFILGIVFLLFGKQIVMLYSNETEVIETGAIMLRYVALVQPFQGAQFILAGALRGAGDTKVTAMITFLTVLLIRTSVAIVLVNVVGMGLSGAWIAVAVDQLLRSALVFARYRSGRWMYKRLKA